MTCKTLVGNIFTIAGIPWDVQLLLYSVFAKQTTRMCCKSSHNLYACSNAFAVSRP